MLSVKIVMEIILFNLVYTLLLRPAFSPCKKEKVVLSSVSPIPSGVNVFQGYGVNKIKRVCQQPRDKFRQDIYSLFGDEGKFY